MDNQSCGNDSKNKGKESRIYMSCNSHAAKKVSLELMRKFFNSSHYASSSPINNPQIL